MLQGHRAILRCWPSGPPKLPLKGVAQPLAGASVPRAPHGQDPPRVSHHFHNTWLEEHSGGCGQRGSLDHADVPWEGLPVHLGPDLAAELLSTRPGPPPEPLLWKLAVTAHGSASPVEEGLPQLCSALSALPQLPLQDAGCWFIPFATSSVLGNAHCPRSGTWASLHPGSLLPKQAGTGVATTPILRTLGKLSPPTSPSPGRSRRGSRGDQPYPPRQAAPVASVGALRAHT